MAQIPDTEYTEQQKLQLLFDWYEKKQELAALQASERAMRDAIVNLYTPVFKEGTNTVKLPTGDELKIVHTVSRSIDKAIFSSILERCCEVGLDVNEVTETKVELKVGNYKKLPPAQREVLDECVTSKHGAAQVSIKLKKD